jgi:hypothetical protein
MKIFLHYGFARQKNDTVPVAKLALAINMHLNRLFFKDNTFLNYVCDVTLSVHPHSAWMLQWTI